MAPDTNGDLLLLTEGDRIPADGRLLDVNAACARMTGYAREELLGMRLADLEACDTPEAGGPLAREVLEGRLERFETRLRRKDGAVVVILNRCMHRGTMVCAATHGHARTFTSR